MKKSTLLIPVICLGIISNVFCQNTSIELTFTAESNSQTVSLDSIYVENLTQEGDTTIYAPQTSLVIVDVGIFDNVSANNSLSISQNFPNPIKQQSNINIFLPEKDVISIRIQNLLGQEVAFIESKLSKGHHIFTFYPCNGDCYILSASSSSDSKSIKMLNMNNKENTDCKIVYQGPNTNQAVYKSEQNTLGFVFAFGDELRYIGYAKTTDQIIGSDVLEDDPQDDETYLFDISQGVPCQKKPYIIYEGQQYQTVQISDQCWLNENLNIGTMINGDSIPTNNNTIEKYCFNNEEDSCSIYGGLYQWNEMMDYSILYHSICPEGWHVPTDEDWTNLTDFCGGTDVAGGVLKEVDTIHWDSPNTGATDELGFTVLPGGSLLSGTFNNLGNRGIIWSSTEDGSSAWTRAAWYDNTTITEGTPSKNYGFSVRCLKNPPNNQPPLPPSDPIPEDEAIEISIDTLLSWTCTDPDGDELFYNVYFGTDSNPPLLAENLTGTIYNPLLEIETTYYWNIVAFDFWGDSTISNTWSFTTGIDSGIDPCLGDTSFIYEGQTYSIVGIGDQCWMAENLNIGNMINGGNYPTDNDTIEKYCYNNEEDNCSIYGGLYRWNEMMDYSFFHHSICPTGWHIPTDEDWTNLTDFFGGTDIAGGILKEVGTVHWDSPNTGATDEYGFTALPGGSVLGGTFNNLGNRGIFWSATQDGSSNAWTRAAWYHNTTITEGTPSKNYGFSVRCLKNPPNNQPPFPPSDPIPEDESFDINIDTLLSWTCTDPDGDDLFHNVYFGTDSNPPLMAENLTDATFNPNLEPDLTYYWKVVAFDFWGDSTISNTWSFTTETDSGVDPCLGDTSFIYEGQTYSIVGIGNQCWMAENLNIGDMINGVINPIDNDTIEKYCYNDEMDSCEIYGGMYKWNEMMDYSTIEGTQGICPTGWHIPTDDDWCNLTQYIDVTVDCDAWAETGFDVGIKMKSTSGWYNDNGTDIFGFTALPGGLRDWDDGVFISSVEKGYFWTSTQNNVNTAWFRRLNYNYNGIFQYNDSKDYGFSVRCVMD